MIDVSDLVGKPFVMGGRGPEAYDCWGVARECYRRWHGVTPPDQVSGNSAHNTALIERQAAQWLRLARTEPGSVVVFRTMGFGGHLGFVLSHTQVIHAETDHVRIERIGRFQHIMGAYLYVV